MRTIWRMTVLLGLVLHVPVLRQVVSAVTRPPRVESVEIDGVPVELVRPAGDGPWPAWLFVTGAHPLRRREPVVERVARGLARAGFVCFVPDLPGLGEGRVSLRTLEATVAIIEAAHGHPDVQGEVALCGASTGASLGLLAAARPGVDGQLAIVAAVTPYADLEKMVCLATTAAYSGDATERRHVTALLRRCVGRSLCGTLPAGTEREALLAELHDEDDELDPLAPFRDRDTRASTPAAAAVISLLANDDPARFPDLYRELPPDARTLVDALSPLAVAARVRTPVEIVVPPVDLYFPLDEAQALAAALPNGRLTVTATLDHTRPSLSLNRALDLARFLAFVYRSLRTAG